MSHSPVLLVSCTRCRQLHAPLHDDVAHPLCGRCQLPRRSRRPGRGRGARARSAPTAR